jgi:hypothetical protein
MRNLTESEVSQIERAVSDYRLPEAYTFVRDMYPAG